MFESIRVVGKFPAIVFLAAFITLSLFYVMQLLIMTNDALPQAGARNRIGDITMPDFELVVNRVTPKPKEILEPPEIPDVLRVNTVNQITVDYTPFQVATANTADIEDIEFIGPADGNAVPLARMEPVYPNQAALNGIEGFVIVEFDVSETGTVINPEILGAQPSSVFNRAALRAIERWKYNPRIVNGKAVKMMGLRTRFSFSLQE